MKLLPHVRLLTYAVLVAVFVAWPDKNRVIPVSLTSGAAWVDAEDAKPTHFLDTPKLQRLTEHIHSMEFPCDSSEFFGQVGIDEQRDNLPCSVIYRSPSVVRRYLVVPRDKNGWGYELVLFGERLGQSKMNVLRAEIWLAQSAYADRPAKSIYTVHDSTYDFRAMMDFLDRRPNQMPEPTSGSVTPRAASSAEPTEARDARVAPPPPVAHR